MPAQDADARHSDPSAGQAAHSPGETAPAPELPELSAGRIRLRTPRPTDRDALFRLFSDADVTRYWSWAAWSELAQADDLIASMAASRRSGDLLQWALTEAGDDALIGTITLASIDRSNQRAELGYALTRSHWGRGLMGEALGVLIDHAFGDGGLCRLEADVDPRNAASISSLERLGFVREGYLRERWRIAGEVQDSVIYGLLKDDWAEVRSTESAAEERR
ncbi:MAG: GNAT family N-acetyltransferase [Phycisphaerales bacterium]